MNIILDYDMIDKIREAKTGISLNYVRKITTKYSVFFGTLDTIINLASNAPYEEIIFDILFRVAINIPLGIGIEKMFGPLNKNNAKAKLITLSNILRNNDINTNYELLLQSYKYDTNYTFINDEKFIGLKQEKFIMVPIINNGEETEVSLVQEHTIGTNEYELSFGTPKKVLKLSLNSI